VVVGLSVKLTTMMTMIQNSFPLQWSSSMMKQIKLIQKSKDKIILGHSKVFKIQYLLEMEDMVKLEQEMEDMLELKMIGKIKLEQESKDKISLGRSKVFQIQYLQEMELKVKLEQELEDIIKAE